MNTSVARRRRKGTAGRRPTLMASRVVRRRSQAAVQRFGIDTFAKTLGLLGVGIYAVLFLAYQRYYSILGIRPEEIGVSQVFLLSRSIAFLILVALPLVYISLSFGLAFAAKRVLKPRKSRKLTPLTRALFSIVYGAFAVCLVEFTRSHVVPVVALRFFGYLMASVLSTISLLLLLLPSLRRAPRHRQFQLMGVIAATFALVAAGAALMDEATESAQLVQQGGEVRPVTMLGLPLLDIESQKVRINWILPSAQRPIDVLKEPAGSCGLLVGRSGTTIFVIPDGAGRVAQLPIASITLRQDPFCSG
jgi:hypothetical protein